MPELPLQPREELAAQGWAPHTHFLWLCHATGHSWPHPVGMGCSPQEQHEDPGRVLPGALWDKPDPRPSVGHPTGGHPTAVWTKPHPAAELQARWEGLRRTLDTGVAESNSTANCSWPHPHNQWPRVLRPSAGRHLCWPCWPKRMVPLTGHLCNPLLQRAGVPHIGPPSALSLRRPCSHQLQHLG